MTLTEIANELVAGCRERRERANLDRLYAPDAVSVEAADMGSGRETRGLEGIRAKHDWWDATFETTAFTTDGPYTHGDDRFAVVFSGRAIARADGATTDMREVAVYTVAGAQIVREEFFYAADAS